MASPVRHLEEHGASVRVSLNGLTEAHRKHGVRVYVLSVPSSLNSESVEAAPILAGQIGATDTYLAKDVHLGDGVAYALIGSGEDPKVAHSAVFNLSRAGEVGRADIEVRDYGLRLIVNEGGGKPVVPARVRLQIKPLSDVVGWIDAATSIDLVTLKDSETVADDGFGVFELPFACTVTCRLDFPVPDTGEYPWFARSFEVNVTDERPSPTHVVSCARGAYVNGQLLWPIDVVPCEVDLVLHHTFFHERVAVATASDGTFHSPLIGPGHYLLYARATGEGGQSYSLQESVWVGAGSTQVAEGTFAAASEVIGICVDASGHALPGIAVVLTGSQASGLTLLAESSGDGGFRIPGVHPGDYTVSAHGHNLAERLRLTVQPGGGTHDLRAMTLVRFAMSDG